ncbi:ADP-ribose pyrophosphatase YjhB (NUDIX family) [Thermonema lapsum]|uniref:ADP-ribose pyrophosphatase YjhB (NUDIX family) n=1 Tax=Thermonema lapsum TaxID=28195 RepID=A0A846MNI8_9BACT|nr:NUDIX domain-containing protein [Thermonema lapsum]NIK72917.1 ADP-ribose pyrophosphatase YjhB (NUDIX family) [Thermonema lapsum]
MNLFLNDIPVFIRNNTTCTDNSTFDTILYSPTADTTLAHRGRLCLVEPSQETILQIIEQLAKEYNPFIYFLEIRTSKIERIVKNLKKQFLYLEAAGGVVYAPTCESFLVIKRLGKWDIPKGKIEAGESPEKTARREVAEESGVAAEIEHFICDTYHTYKIGNQIVLKKTYWYLLKAAECPPPKPQTEESIEEALWVPYEKISSFFQPTYTSIRFVWECVLKQKFNHTKS